MTVPITVHLDDSHQGESSSRIYLIRQRCVMTVTESGRDWQGSMRRAHVAFTDLLPTRTELLDWNVSSRSDLRIERLEILLDESASRVSGSRRESTSSEMSFELAMTMGSDESWHDENEISGIARDAARDLFTWDATRLAQTSLREGVVLNDATIDTVSHLSTERVDGNSNRKE